MYKPIIPPFLYTRSETQTTGTKINLINVWQPSFSFRLLRSLIHRMHARKLSGESS